MAEPVEDPNENPDESETPEAPTTFFTSENIDEIWAAEDPIGRITQMLVPRLPDLAEHQSLPILAEHLLHGISKAKHELGLDSQFVYMWAEILLDSILPSVEEKKFDLQEDLKRFKTLVEERGADFDKSALAKLTKDVVSGVYSHYSLFTFVFTMEREKVLLETDLTVEHPAVYEKLEYATEIIVRPPTPEGEKEKTPSEIDKEEADEFERRLEEFGELDRKRIRSVLKKIENKLETQIDSRKDTLESKFEEISKERAKSSKQGRRK